MEAGLGAHGALGGVWRACARARACTDIHVLAPSAGRLRTSEHIQHAGLASYIAAPENRHEASLENQLPPGQGQGRLRER